MHSYGEVILAAGGAFATKPRPVLVVQDQKYYTGESIIVMPFTSTENPEIKTRVLIQPTVKNGLDRKCYVEVEKISAIRLSCLSKTVGFLEDEHLRDIKRIAYLLLMMDNGK